MSGAVSWRGLWWLMGLGLVLRVACALVARQYSYLDEIYQYLEQAHRLTFGYGWIPWEYRHGTRSWGLPMLVAAPLFLCKWLGVDGPQVYVPMVKIMFSLLSVSIIYSSYVIGRVLVSERAGRLAALLTCVWYELVYDGPKVMADMVGGTLIFLALALVLRGERGWRAGVLLGMTLGFRIQYLPVAAGLGALALLKGSKAERLGIITGGAVVLLAFGALDKVMWGGWFFSYIANYAYNMTYEVSLTFGVEPWDYYLSQLFYASGGLFVAAFAGGVFYWRRLWVLVAGVALTVGPLSVLLHKEYRFIFLAVPLLVVMGACAAELLLERMEKQKARICEVVASLAFATVLVLGGLYKLPNEKAVYVVNPFRSANNYVEAEIVLGHDPSVRGILVDTYKLWAGGYYFLHKEAPIYANPDFKDVKKLQSTLPKVSHILCHKKRPAIAGFITSRRIGNLDIRIRETYGPFEESGGAFEYNIFQENVESILPKPMAERRL